MSKTGIYCVTETVAENGGDKVIKSIALYDSREKAVAALHEKYLDARLHADGVGEFSADYNADTDTPWYSVVDNDDTIREGEMSDALTIQ